MTNRLNLQPGREPVEDYAGNTTSTPMACSPYSVDALAAAVDEAVTEAGDGVTRMGEDAERWEAQEIAAERRAAIEGIERAATSAAKRTGIDPAVIAKIAALESRPTQAERVAHANALLDEYEAERDDRREERMLAFAKTHTFAEAEKERALASLTTDAGNVDPPAAKPSFLAGRRDILTRDNAKMRAMKAGAQAEISRLRKRCFELTQSIRSNEDALDRLMENEG